MIIETRKVYRCEHCNKWYISASACSVHEKFCRKKPENKHKCFDFCKHLEMRNCYPKKEFECKITGKQMYSFKYERMKYYHGSSIKKDDGERMPLKCDLFCQMKQDYDGNYIKETE